MSREKSIRQNRSTLSQTIRHTFHSRRDDLTGVLNRYGLDFHIQKQLNAHPKEAATLVSVDVDHFKEINDLAGRGAGDEILIALADGLRAGFPRSAIIGRNGSDEFLVFLPDRTSDQSLPLIKDFTAREFHAEYSGKPLTFRVTAGYACYPEDADEFSSLCRMSDAALYGVKLNGKGRYLHFTKGMNRIDRRKLGFDLNDIASGIPGSLTVSRLSDAEILFANEDTIALFGCKDYDDLIDLTGGNFAGMIAPEDLRRVCTAIHNRIHSLNESTDYINYRIRTRSGNPVNVCGLCRIVHNSYYGDVLYTFLYNKSIEAEGENEQSVLGSATAILNKAFSGPGKEYELPQNIRSVLETSAIPLAVGQYRSGRLLTTVVSDGLLAMKTPGISRDELVNIMNTDRYRDVLPQDNVRLASESLSFARNSSAVYDIIYQEKLYGQDEYRYIHARGHHQQLENNAEIAVIFYEDITNIADQYLPSDKAQAFSYEYHDHLTGLPNMDYCMNMGPDFTAKIRKEGKKPSLLYMDLHGMKHYNRAYGFPAGNSLLLDVARSLQRHFPGSLISRFSDDHFFVLTGSEDVEKRFRAVQEDIRQNEYGLDMSLYCGIYNDPQETDFSQSCDNVRLACEQISHDLNRSISYYHPDIRQSAMLREYVIENIDRAILNGWIEIYLQPVVRTSSATLSSFEALARWDDPIHGLLNPGEFISALEESHQIHKLDCYVAQELCRILRRRMDSGLTVVPVSFNLSRMDFLNCDIYRIIEDAVNENRIPPSLLCIEVTESLLAAEQYIRDEVQKFRRAGHSVWMDDFGSGYSSLNILKDYEFDEIKIDMKFLSSFSGKSKIIIASVVEMAKRIGIETLAEGVETQEHFDFLRSIGCEKVQGYLYGKPLPMKKAWQNVADKKLFPGLKTEGVNA